MTAPISTAVDNLTAAIKSNIIPNQEYLLQGSVLDSCVEVLLHRLGGLCDNVDVGHEQFDDHEMCFSIRKYALSVIIIHLIFSFLLTQESNLALGIFRSPSLLWII